MNKILNILLLTLAPVLANAQAVDNFMRSSGRIYVVIAVMLVIFFGLILYIIKIDRKISKLRKGIPD